MPALTDTTILALDPSTEITGAAIVSFAAGGASTLSQWKEFNACHIGRATDLASRLRRIAWTRRQLLTFVDSWPGAIDLVAYETDTERGHAASEALKMATGAYLTIYPLEGLPVVGITRQAACKASGTLSVYAQRSGTTTAERAAKKRRLKLSVIEWANRRDTFDAGLREDQDAIADALAVARAAWNQQEALRLAPRPLFGRGSRGPRGGKL